MFTYTQEQQVVIQNNAAENLGVTLRYKELCKALNIEPEKSPTTKQKQLRDLQTLIELKEIPIGKQTGYVITKVYPEPLLPYYDNDEWYAAIKSQICAIFQGRDNEHDSIWFVRKQLLYALGAVNHNYMLLMSENKRYQMSKYYERSFDHELDACRIAGGIIADRIYDALERMESERLIICTNGYVLRIMTGGSDSAFIEIPCDDVKDSLFQYLFNAETKIIDEVAEENKTYAKNASYKNRNRVKFNYYEEVIKKRNEFVRSPEFLGELNTRFNTKAIAVQNMFDVKFITPIWAETEKYIEHKPFAKSLINKASQEKILASKNKKLERYKDLIDGMVKIFISADPTFDYSKATL